MGRYFFFFFFFLSLISILIVFVAGFMALARWRRRECPQIRFCSAVIDAFMVAQGI